MRTGINKLFPCDYLVF